MTYLKDEETAEDAAHKEETVVTKCEDGDTTKIDTLRSETFAGRNFRGLKKPRNFCISREKTFADGPFKDISRE